MIIGHGDIASALIDRPDVLFFASGVSNSRETRETEYEREKRLLLTQRHYPEGGHLVYFSSLSIFYADTRYTRHKLDMERLVRLNFIPYTIVRLGNITWGTNPHTLINYIRNRIRNRLPVDVQNAYRYIIDRDEFQHWMAMIPPWSCEMNVVGRRMKVRDIITEYCYPWKDIDAIIEGCREHESEMLQCSYI